MCIIIIIATQQYNYTSDNKNYKPPIESSDWSIHHYYAVVELLLCCYILFPLIQYGITPLNIASSWGEVAIVNILLNAGADPSPIDKVIIIVSFSCWSS